MQQPEATTGSPGPGARLRRSFGRLSLRARLLIGLILLSAVGLVVSDVVIYNTVENYLNSQVSQDLSVIQPRSLTIANGRFVSGPFNGGEIPPGVLVEVFSYSDLSKILVTDQPRNSLLIPPDVLADLQQQIAAQQAVTPVTFTATSSTGTAYRTLVQGYTLGPPGGFGRVPVLLAVGIPLPGLPLLEIELAVTAIVLGLLIGFGYVVVQLGIRPLREIEATASRIAAGDLSQRVERDEPTTEIGRLGASLNEMLAQIEHSYDEKVASEGRLRQFLADASHELRTPVTSIRGYAELFRRGAANRPEDLARAMQRIEDESVRMGMLVDDLLLLARLDQGRPLEHALVDLSSLVGDAAADAQVLEPDREVSAAIAPQVTVLGDVARLHQVIANLLQNAFRYSPPGSPVEVSLAVDENDARLSVADHGIGIALEHVAHIFERFYRADPSRTRERGGTGLGLAIVASIVAAHGGTVAVDSTLGEGSVFRVTLPLAGASEDGEAAPALSEPAPPPENEDAFVFSQGTSEAPVRTPGPR